MQQLKSARYTILEVFESVEDHQKQMLEEVIVKLEIIMSELASYQEIL